jgi:hypothetical protein
MEESQNFKKAYGLYSPTKSINGLSDLESSIERNRDICDLSNDFNKRNIQELKKVSFEYLMFIKITIYL